MALIVRDATADDAAACAAIYAPYVRETAITFETEPPSADEIADRIAAASATHAWLVGTVDDVVIGYAYAGPFHRRSAYRWTCEVSVYLESGRRRTGAGRALYTALLDRLSARGYRNAIALIAVPNEASLGLHAELGFVESGRQPAVGYKLGTWRDVVWMQRALANVGDPPAEPR